MIHKLTGRSRHLLFLCLAASVVITACGSSGNGSAKNAAGSSPSDSNGCITRANAITKAAESVPKLPFPSSIDVSSLKGKLVVFIPTLLSIPLAAVEASGAKAAAAAAGLKFKVIDGGGTAEGWLQAANEAVSLHADAVIFQAVTPELATSAYAALKSANIPIVTINPDVPSTVKYSIDNDWNSVGRLQAAYALSQTKCDTNAAIFTYTTSDNTRVSMNAANSTVHSLCSTCETTVINVDLSTLSTSVGLDTTSAIQRDPKLNFIIAGFDALSPFIIPAVKSSSSNLQLDGHAGTSVNFDYVKAGNVETATVVTYPPAEQGWMGVDDSMRAMLGQPPATQWFPMPVMLLTAGDYSATTSFWNATPQQYEAKFKEIWGIG